MNTNPFIEIDPRRCDGKPVVAGTRIPVTVVLDQLAETGSLEGLARKYPELDRKTIVGVLTYCRSVIQHTELEPQPA